MMKKKECIKEFKVRMDQVKCEKYKTFQPELPTKKFLFSDEKESIHNMKILWEDSSGQNKATTVHGEDVKDQEPGEKKSEEGDEVRKAMTGMFRDNLRRIDLVLVVEDDVMGLANNIKLEFLSYIVRAGLEVEIEPGVMKKHKNLTFIKVHAPDPVLKKFGKFFGTKRYFADTRYDYMKNKTKNYEKEWVMLARNNYNTPNGYSNYERSIIAYKILLHLSFGDNVNYYGIERLLNKKIIVDVFALHDGPYFITPDQTISGSNARQILNYYWSGKQNIFKQQPLHLVHEYFGPRIAFYFAFYEFFNKALKVAAFIGLFNMIFGYLNSTNIEQDLKKSICKMTDKICQFCKDKTICPARESSDYCLSMTIHLVLDHILVPLYSIATVIGAFTFLRLWQRREYFLKWMWEVGRHDSYYKNAIRPLFNIGFGARTDPFISGFQYSENKIPIILRNVISKAILIMYWYIIVPLMYFVYNLYLEFAKKMRTSQYYEKYRDYVVMSMFQIFYTLWITVLDKIYHHIVYYYVKYENHSTYKKFHNSIVIKKVGFKMLLQYVFVAYFAWIHGAHPRYLRCHVVKWSPYTTLRYVLYAVYGYKDKDVCQLDRFCFPYSCVIEVSTLLSTLLIVTQVIYKISDYIFSFRTDYNQSRYSDLDIPCWEREYRLISVTEEVIVEKYINLAAQLCIVTWFVITFPLAPLILYLINTWHIRHEARKLLLASRRPLLIKTPGTGMTNVFYFIAYVAVLTNAINIAALTRSKLRYLMFKLGKTDEEVFKFIHYFYLTCYAQGQIVENDKTDSTKLIYNYFYDLHNVGIKLFFRVDYYLLFLYGLYHFILFVLAMGYLIPIIFETIPRQREVETARAREEKVRALYYYYEYEYKDSKNK